MKLILPYPPSANRYWRNLRGRMVKSRQAAAYCDTVGWLAKAEGAQTTDAEVSVTVDVYRPRRSGDLDNRLKIVLDALQGTVYADDKQVIEIHARRFDDKQNPRVEVTVREHTT